MQRPLGTRLRDEYKMELLQEFIEAGDGSVLDCAPILDEFLRAAGSPAWI